MGNEIQTFLRKRRLNCNLSQENVAYILGISRQSVSKWERGESVPKTKNMLKICELYRIDVIEITQLFK